jgi:hypothetical protein
MGAHGEPERIGARRRPQARFNADWWMADEQCIALALDEKKRWRG